jgi:UDP-galactopyranose mutase
VDANISRYGFYKVLADRETVEREIFFSGRLATYSYLNIDEAIESALDLFQALKKRSAHADAVGCRARL